MTCPWFVSKRVFWYSQLSGRNKYRRVEYCNLFPAKPSCLLLDEGIGLASADKDCLYVKRFISYLVVFNQETNPEITEGKKIFLHQAFSRAKPILLGLLLASHDVSKRNFEEEIGLWLQERCRRNPQCPYKPLLPENQ